MNQEVIPNSTISHYRIISKLGAGGMGEVWLAQDSKLDRKVALKILPADVASNKDRMDRFVREAKSAAALNHPNIAHVYEIGESDGTHFIAMEFIDGDTLREKIHRDKTQLSKLLRYLSQVASGLAKAHSIGIVHRDLKPDNIMITRDDYAKVLDFGLAKLVEPQSSFGLNDSGSSDIATAVMQQHSVPGIVMGTIGYMSPEQASGRTNEIDHRSDIFSFGCILFEAATGKKAFEGKDALDSLHKIVHAPTPQLKDINPLAPDDLQRVIRRCLAKEPEKRYQSIKEVAIEIDDLQEELKGLTTSNYSASQASATIVTTSGAGRHDEGFWVAVLPLKYRGSNADIEALAEGLAEDIVTGLSRFSYLRVIARSSTLRFTGENVDVRLVGKEIGARYVMEGNLRQVGARMRLAVQLVDATTGAHLWAENYERTFTPEAVFELQDDLVPRIVSTVADWYGVLPHTMSEAVRLKPSDQLSPYEALLRSFGYFERITPEEHAIVRSGLERAVEQEPGNADGWAMLSMMFGEEHRFGFNVLPDPLRRSLRAARQAVDGANANHFAWLALAQALFFRKEFDVFRDAAERAIKLNPMDGSTVEYLGHLIAFSGDWERGCELAERARQLNPHHPGWYWAVPFLDAYRKGDYRSARTFILKGNQPGHYFMQALVTAAYGQVGEPEPAKKALSKLLNLKPDFAKIGRNEFAKWYPPELVDQLMDGLRKAGLEISDDVSASTSATPSFVSSKTRADEGFWVAVLPFKFTGSSTEIATLAEGFSEEIVTGLSRFSYLRVISRSSTMRYASETIDVRTVGKELGARYVMDGSLRVAGSMLRVSVQLVDTITGAHLWAETFNRHFQPDQIFAMQDELIPRIVSTCADHFGVLARSISDAVRGKKSSQLSPYEALMRGFGYHYRLNPLEHAEARDILEQAVKEAPNNADCWAMLSWVYSHEFGHGFNIQPGSLDRALAAARRAVDLAPTNHLAYQTLAVALFFRKERANCLSAAERALALNPLDASNEAIFLITFVDDWERGCSLIRRAMDLNPYVPGWFRLILALNDYRKDNYRKAVTETVTANAPGIWTDIVLSAAYGQLGEQALACGASKNLIAQNSAESVRELLTKWFDAELVEHLVEGLCKAGLGMAAQKSTATSTTEAKPTSASREGVGEDRGETNATPKPIAAAGFESRPAIAVLPFDNLSTDPEQDYFADGLAEDLITRLSLWRSFPVIACNSTFAYKGKAIDVKKVSADLGVRYVVQGSVRKANNQVRISAQLIDATTGHHVWAKTYDRELIDVFAVQDEISEAIAVSLVGDLERAEHSRLQRRTPDSLEAWGLYHRALPLIYNFTREDCAQARSLLERAIEHDPHFATALARLAEVCVWEVLYEWTEEPETTLNQAISTARRAVALDSLDAQAHVDLSFALMTASDGRGALEESRQAVELNPSMPFALAIHAYHRHIAGYPPEESIAFVQRALRLSPHDPVEWLFYDVLAGAYLNAGRFQEGLEAGRRLITLSPNYYWGYLWSAMNSVGLGQIEEARKLVKEARRVKPSLSFELARKCLGTMAVDVEHRFSKALQQAGLEEKREEGGKMDSRESLSHLIKTIAVLPFHNLSGDPEQEFFADGITEEIINALAQIRGLRVAGRSSSFSFKGRNEDLRSVGAKLNVTTILEGTLRRSDNRLRITAQLIDAATGYQLWSERYDRVMEDVFAVQDEIANKIAGRLQLSLVPGTVQQVAPPTKHIRAYELYLKGRGLLYQRGLSIPKAIDCFTQAVALDPEYAQAWAGLADGYTTSGYSGFNRPVEVMPRALDAAKRALELDPELAEAHNALACASLLYSRDYELATGEFQRALELNPHYPQARSWYGLFYLHWIAGREEEGREELFRLLRVDPLSGYANVIFSFSCYTSDRLEEAVEHCRRGVELDPGSYLAQWCLSVALRCTGQYEEAEVAVDRALSLSGRHCWALATSVSIYAAWGKPDKAREAFAELQGRSQREYIQPSMLIEGAAAIGEIDQAIQYAQQAFDERDPLFVLLARLWPGYDPLRKDPRFLKIIGQLSLPGWSVGRI